MMEKTQIISVLEAMADLLELQGENPFKVRAYRTGARALQTLEGNLQQLIDAEKLESVDGIGKALSDKVTVLFRTGVLPAYEELKAKVPSGLLQMLDIPGLGPKKTRKLYDALGVDSIEALAEACRKGTVAQLEGFGQKTVDNLLTALSNREAYRARHLWLDAWTAAEPLINGLRLLPAVVQADVAGSLRRCLETVGDIDFIAASSEPQAVMDWFCSQPNIREVSAKGRTKSSVRLIQGLQADLRVVPPDRYAFALHHFTGSKEHNVRMRQRALERGFSLSEWGLFLKDSRSGEESTSTRKPDVGAASENDLFSALGLAWIPPELREGLGEIDSAEAQTLPRLVEARDVRGTFHNHTTASDGQNTLEEMVEAAQALGWEYIGIADHSQSSRQANGLSEQELLRQVQTIRELNASGRFCTHVFAGSEVDILKDGSLDFTDGVLSQLDYTVVSVHARYVDNEDEMTARIIRAIENPHTTMLGHLTGRLLLRRESYAVNVSKVIDAAIANRTLIELNASPYRLDMDWRHWQKALEKGLMCVINTDAHQTASLGFYTLGIQMARKAGVTREKLVNHFSLNEVKMRLHNRKFTFS